MVEVEHCGPGGHKEDPEHGTYDLVEFVQFGDGEDDQGGKEDDVAVAALLRQHRAHSHQEQPVAGRLHARPHLRPPQREKRLPVRQGRTEDQQRRQVHCQITQTNKTPPLL